MIPEKNNFMKKSNSEKKIGFLYHSYYDVSWSAIFGISYNFVPPSRVCLNHFFIKCFFSGCQNNSYFKLFWKYFGSRVLLK